jgi:hypothetical protein
MVYNEKAIVDSKFDDVADIASGKDNFCIRVRVVRLWKVPAFLNPYEYRWFSLMKRLVIYFILFSIYCLVNSHLFGGMLSVCFDYMVV